MSEPKRGQQIANPQNQKTQPAFSYRKPVMFGVVCYTAARAQIIVNTVKTKVLYRNHSYKKDSSTTQDDSSFWRIYRNASYPVPSSCIRTLGAQLCFCFYLLIKYLTTVFHIKERTIFSTRDTDKSGTLMSSKNSQENKGDRQEHYCIRAANICIPGITLRAGNTMIGKSQIQTSWGRELSREVDVNKRKRHKHVTANGIKY